MNLPNHNNYVEAPLAMPTAPDINDNNNEGITRRKFLRTLLIASALASRPIKEITSLSLGYIEDEIWPNNEPSIKPVNGIEHIPIGGVEWMMADGFGREYPDNGSRELFYDLNNTEAVHAVQNSNRGLKLESMADKFIEYVKQRQMTQLNIVGVSMGLTVWLKLLEIASTKATLPPVGLIVGYSSPGDINDVIDKKMAELALEFIQSARRIGVLEKLIYSEVDGSGDWLKAINVFNKSQWLLHQKDSIAQTFNHTSPWLAGSQLGLLGTINLNQVGQNLSKTGVIDGATLLYIGSKYDRTVNNNTAFDRLSRHLPISKKIIMQTPNGGHAETEPSAKVLSQFVNLQNK
jgi:hypothetical protein